MQALLPLAFVALATTSHQADFQVADLDRLAITPRIDGLLEYEEWDPMGQIGRTEYFFQWQPDFLHLAARLPIEKDFIASFDLRSNGWLVGKDNLEVRVQFRDGRPLLRTRILDATQEFGPRWIDAPAYAASAQVAAVRDEDMWTVEISLQDPGLHAFPSEPGKTLGMRCDAMDIEEQQAQPFMPRAMAQVRFAYERSVGLPAGLAWKPAVEGRAPQPGSSTRIRQNFEGYNEIGLKRIEIRSEGLARESTNLIQMPFPEFDRKGRALVDFETPIAKDAVSGFRVLRSTLKSEDGATAVMQLCYRIAPVVDIEFVDESLKTKEKERKVRFSVYVASNTTDRIDGTLIVEPPHGFAVVSGNNNPVVIYHARSKVRRVFELEIPANATGTYPIDLVFNMGQKRLKQTAWITIR